MSNNKTTLDSYIARLMHDDGALNKFLADPTNAGQEHGITKAERAVLRRVTANLSNKSKNGYGIRRDLGSYRRSLRLLQNVLHKHSGAHAAVLSNVTGSTTYSFYVYITGDPSNPGAPYDNPSLAYKDYIHFTTSGSNFTTVGEAMYFSTNMPATQGSVTDSILLGNANDSNGVSGTISYKAVFNNNDWYVLEFDLQGFSPGIAGTYQLPFEVNGVPVTGTDRLPFWFFSLNGTAISPNSNQGYSLTGGNVIEGDDGESFLNFNLGSSTQIVWQPISPDMDYGFAACFSTTFTPIVLGIPVLEKDVVNVGQPFYTNTVNNVPIPSNATKALLALNPDGSGNIRTDDDVTINFVGTKGSYTYYMDYSNGCSGVITSTDPVDVFSQLQANGLIGDTVTITITYSDKCGGKISSSGYFLVFG